MKWVFLIVNGSKIRGTNDAQLAVNIVNDNTNARVINCATGEEMRWGYRNNDTTPVLEYEEEDSRENED